jgi:hypothetical protein
MSANHVLLGTLAARPRNPAVAPARDYHVTIAVQACGRSPRRRAGGV